MCGVSCRGSAPEHGPFPSIGLPLRGAMIFLAKCTDPQATLKALEAQSTPRKKD